MANTTKIKKSKYLSYQKQGFLYLVFILFLFFSQAGEYVMHYTSLAKTQKALNTYLESRLSSLILEDASDDQYRNDVLNRLTSLEQISDRFDVYESQSIAGLDQYRENRFAERQVRRGELGTVFNATWNQQQSQSNGRWTPTELIDYNGSSSNATDFFFKETPNAVILLDELSRAHPDAWNILMTVLDYGQRYLRLDESTGSDTIKVAEGVTFVATANIGNEYTSTRVMDKALMDRFTIVEMDVLNEEDENSLLNIMFPSVDSMVLGNVAKIATLTRTESSSDTARITSGISTRTTVELCGLLFDGFSLEESAEVSIYPQYDSTGGVDSERTFVKQIVQKFCDDGSSDDLFNEDEMAEATEDDNS